VISTALLLSLVAIATVTDIRSRRIPNYLVYPGLAVALAINLATTWFSEERMQELRPLVGWIGWQDCLTGLAVCGLFMLVCFVFFGIGGGDVKLLAMIGAFLGLHQGLETLLWTFTLGWCLGLSLLVWRVGIPRLTALVWRQLRAMVRWGMSAGLTEEERRELKSDLLLAPCALVAIVVVRFDLLQVW
jgi:prepilin peptidase CpaA